MRSEWLVSLEANRRIGIMKKAACRLDDCSTPDRKGDPEYLIPAFPDRPPSATELRDGGLMLTHMPLSNSTEARAQRIEGEAAHTAMSKPFGSWGLSSAAARGLSSKFIASPLFFGSFRRFALPLQVYPVSADLLCFWWVLLPSQVCSTLQICSASERSSFLCRFALRLRVYPPFLGSTYLNDLLIDLLARLCCIS